jgi:hypothetical protein
MFKKVTVLFCLLFILVGQGCVSSKEKKPGPPARQGVVTGIVRQKGNAPRQEIVIHGFYDQEKGGPFDFRVTGPRGAELGEFLYRKVEARGTVKKSFVRFAGDTQEGKNHYSIEVESFILVEE